jgi:hypothetical protein
VAGATLPAYLIYRRLFVREDAALRQAVAEVSAQVEAGTPRDEAPEDPTERSGP